MVSSFQRRARYLYGEPSTPQRGSVYSETLGEVTRASPSNAESRQTQKSPSWSVTKNETRDAKLVSDGSGWEDVRRHIYQLYNNKTISHCKKSSSTTTQVSSSGNCNFCDLATKAEWQVLQQEDKTIYSAIAAVFGTYGGYSYKALTPEGYTSTSEHWARMRNQDSVGESNRNAPSRSTDEVSHGTTLQLMQPFRRII